MGRIRAMQPYYTGKSLQACGNQMFSRKNYLCVQLFNFSSKELLQFGIQFRFRDPNPIFWKSILRTTWMIENLHGLKRFQGFATNRSANNWFLRGKKKLLAFSFQVSQDPENVLGLQWREMDPSSLQQLLWDLGARVQKLVAERDAGLEVRDTTVASPAFFSQGVGTFGSPDPPVQ